jgi:hypothetical protein
MNRIHQAFRAASVALAIALAAAPIAALLAEAPAHATTFANLTLEQMTDASTAVIRGTVLEVWSEQDANGRIWTRAKVQVTETYKGANVPAELIVDQIGGTYQGLEMNVAGRAWFAPGEDAMLFLYYGPNHRWNIVEKYLGKFLIRRSPGETRLYARTWQQDEDFPIAYDPRFLPHPAEADRIYLDDLVARVKDRAVKGWDGQPIPGLPHAELERINLPENRIVTP